MGKTKFVSKHIALSGTKRNPEDRISQEFANSVRKKLKNHVKESILFGSHARGDFTEGSDYDFLIVVDKQRRHLVMKPVGDIDVINAILAKAHEKLKNLPKSMLPGKI